MRELLYLEAGKADQSSEQHLFCECGTVVDSGDEETCIGCSSLQALTAVASTLQHNVIKLWERISPWAGEDFMRGESERFCSGTFKFKVNNLSHKMADARAGGMQCLLSQEFHLQPQGYKYHLEVYPNGVPGSSNYNVMSVRLKVPDGEWDDTERWPGDDIILRLLDLHGGIKPKEYLLTPDETPKVYNQPNWERFVSQDEVTKEGSLYVKNDTLVFQVMKVKNRVGTNLMAAGAEGIKPHQM